MSCERQSLEIFNPQCSISYCLELFDYSLCQSSLSENRRVCSDKFRTQLNLTSMLRRTVGTHTVQNLNIAVNTGNGNTKFSKTLSYMAKGFWHSHEVIFQIKVYHKNEMKNTFSRIFVFLDATHESCDEFTSSENGAFFLNNAFTLRKTKSGVCGAPSTTTGLLESENDWEGGYGCQEVKTTLEPRRSPFASKLHHRNVCILNQLASVHRFLKSQWATSLNFVAVHQEFQNLTLYTLIYFYLIVLFIWPFIMLLIDLRICCSQEFIFCKRTRPWRLKKDPQLCSVM